MERIGIYEAKSRLSELVERAETGREVTITRHGKPVAKLVPAREAKGPNRSALIDEIIAFSRTCKLKRRVNLRKFASEGRD
jgi:prevent-host-death family protein